MKYLVVRSKNILGTYEVFEELIGSCLHFPIKHEILRSKTDRDYRIETIIVPIKYFAGQMCLDMSQKSLRQVRLLMNKYFNKV